MAWLGEEQPFTHAAGKCRIQSEEQPAIVTAVGSALDYTHPEGLLHRDVKPANILLSNAEDPAQRRILLTDFGIARALNDVSDLDVELTDGCHSSFASTLICRPRLGLVNRPLGLPR